MNDQAKNWVWDYEKNVTIICKTFFRRDPDDAEDVAHNVLLRISQRDGLDQVGDRSKWIRTVAYHECMDYFRKLNRHPDWKGESLEDPGVGGDEKLSDAKLDKEASGSAEDIENETDGPDSKDASEKIDPVKCWRSFERRDPDRAAALNRSFFFVTQAFSSIKLYRDFLEQAEQVVKLLATLQDAKRRMEKIFSTCTDQDIKKYAGSVETERDRKFDFEVILQYHIRKLIRLLSVADSLADIGIIRVASKGAKGPYYNYHRGSVSLYLYYSFVLKGDVMKASACHHYRMRTRDFIHVDPDPLYVLYRIWNQLLRKGGGGKYGNRKLLKVMLFAFKKKEQALLKHYDTFNSLTEKMNFETLRTMSYRLNKGYSELADFIFRKSVRPPKRKTTPTDEKKPALPSSISSRH